MNITLAKGEDWEGLYLNGKLIEQNHKISCVDMLKLLGQSVVYVDLDWLEEKGTLPENLSDVRTK